LRLAIEAGAEEMTVRADPEQNETRALLGFVDLEGRRVLEIGSGDGRLRHLAFAVGDIDTAVARVRAHGGELVGEVESYEDIYRLCYVRGPDG
jgi:catechol 2,3-dioxygenase-like lactoylglutathione lyase family enzyme